MAVDVVAADGTHRSAVDPTVAFAAHLERHRDRPAVIDALGQVWTYSSLAAHADEVASRLGPHRQLVAVVAEPDVTTIVGYLGALRGGHVVLLLPPGDASARARLLEQYEPDVVIQASPEPGVPAFHGRPGPSNHSLHEDLALLIPTSGSTGSPKLVRLSHTNLQANADAIGCYLGLTTDDRAAMSLPLHYCYGLSVVHSHLAVGASIVLAGGSVVDRCFWDRFRAHGCTSFAGVPYTFELLDRAGFEDMVLPTLRYITQAGGRMAPERVADFAALGRRKGWDLFVMYGQTEATARMAFLPPELAVERPSAIGQPVPGGSFRIEPTAGADADVDAGVGELVYSGPNVMLGYAHCRADLSLGREIDDLHTGDLARLDADGLVEIVGRSSRFAKAFGVRVDLDQVERSLAERGVDALCAAGLDEHLALAVSGDSPAAGHDGAAEVARSIARELHLPVGAVHAVWVFELPRLATGKPDHRRVLELVDADRARTIPPRDTDSVGPVVAQGRRSRTVRQVYAEVVDVEVVGDSDTFVSLGGDSLSYVEVSLLLEDVLGDLPDGWHTMRVDQLDSRPARPRALRSVETNVVLRALAIVAVVGTHASVYLVQGGAHILLAIAGYNFARFRLTVSEASDRLRRAATSIARIVVPAVIWVCFMFTWREPFSVPRLLFIDNVAGEGLWRYWYVEVLLQLLVVLTLVFSFRALRDLERRRPFAVACGALGVGIVLRFSPWFGSVEEPMYRTDTVAWIFLLGWAIQRSRTVPQRLLLSVVTVVCVIGFFDSFDRGRLVALGVLVLIWMPRVRLPRPLARVVGVLAGASLYIFLTHYAVLPLLHPQVPAWAVLVTALIVGVLADALVQRVRPVQWLRRRQLLRADQTDGSTAPRDLREPARG